MNINDIKKQLSLYYNGETTDQEEKELIRFFTEEDVPDELRKEKLFFSQLYKRNEMEIPDGMDKRLESLIDSWENTEKRSRKVKRNKRFIKIEWIGSIAASILILLGIGTYLYKPYNNVATSQDTCKNPEEAYAQAQKALVLLSSTVNKGMEEMEYVSKTTTKVKEKVNEQLNLINPTKE